MNEKNNKNRILLCLRIVLTIIAWIAVIVYAHSLAHRYEAELVNALTSPYYKLVAAIIFLTGLIYFVVLSLPFVPNLKLRGVIVTLIWASLIIFGHSVSHEGFHEIESDLTAMQGQLGMVGLLAIAAIYSLALAMPFVPGVELGLLIIAILGAAGALVAYIATVLGLSIAFMVGRGLPQKKANALLRRMGVNAESEEVDSRMQVMLPRRGLVLTKVSSILITYRHITLAVALNFPGNSAVGGGGGLAMLCGMSRKFDWRGFLLTTAIATSPLPLLVISGLIDVQPLLEHHGFLHNLLARLESVFTH